MTAGVNNRTRAQQWEYPEAFFREAIVIVHTDFTERTESRDACVASYEEPDGRCNEVSASRRASSIGAVP